MIKVLNRYFIFKPSDAFGNRAEEIYFALLKCRREKKRLIILRRKFDLFYKFRFRDGNSALLYINHPIIVEHPVIELFNYLMSIWLAALRIIGILLLKIRHHLGFQTDNIFLTASECPVNRNTIWTNRIFWNAELENKLNVTFGPRKAIESVFPILTGKKYICLHVRTPGFWNDHINSKFRNADIENYIPAIRELVNQGFLVIRLGDPTMPKIRLDGVIDYANSQFRSKNNDILLLEHCEFYIGGQSGPIDTACLFEKKILTVNCISLACYFWYRNGSRFIPKKAMMGKKVLSLKEQIDHDLFEAKGTGTMNEQINYLENTKEEILDAVREFISFTDLAPVQNEFNDLMENRLMDYFENKLILMKNKKNDFIEKNRWISRIHNIQGSICKGYLEKNWDDVPIFSLGNGSENARAPSRSHLWNESC